MTLATRLGFSNDSRAYGPRLTADTGHSSFEIRFDAIRREPAGNNAPEHSLQLRLNARR